MAEALVDIALELNASYSEAMKNNVKKTKREIFLGILKTLFEIHGRYFGYDNSPRGLSAFKSDVVRVKNRLKEAKKKFMPKPSWYEHPDPPEVLWMASDLGLNILLDEGNPSLAELEAELLGTEDPFN